MAAVSIQEVTVSVVLNCPSCVGTYSVLPDTYQHQRPVYKLSGSARYLKMDRLICRWTIENGAGTLLAMSPQSTTACDPVSAFDHD